MHVGIANPSTGGGENVHGIPGACATRDFTYLARGTWLLSSWGFRRWLDADPAPLNLCQRDWPTATEWWSRATDSCTLGIRWLICLSFPFNGYLISCYWSTFERHNSGDISSHCTSQSTLSPNGHLMSIIAKITTIFLNRLKDWFWI